MSLLLNTPFAVKIQLSNINKIAYLLKSLGALERQVADFSQLKDVLSRPVNWDVINENIQCLRTEGLNYLKGVLK